MPFNSSIYDLLARMRNPWQMVQQPPQMSGGPLAPPFQGGFRPMPFEGGFNPMQRFYQGKKKVGGLGAGPFGGARFDRGSIMGQRY